MNESTIRLTAFLGVLAVMAVWEVLAPRRPRVATRPRRWLTNFGMIVLGTIPLQWIFPILAMGMAVLAADRGWGILNIVPVSPWVAVVAGAVALDFVIYLQHLLFHAVPTLWRFHKVHHTDRDLDVTSAVRFHPLEIWLSMVIKLAAVAFIGPPPIAVLIFEIVLNGTAMFNHSNVRMPLPLDRLLRLIVVTPDMHRVHHSTDPKETDANYGFNLPWWDRILGTYRAQPSQGHTAMTIGLDQHPDPAEQHLVWALLLPFKR